MALVCILPWFFTQFHFMLLSGTNFFSFLCWCRNWLDWKLGFWRCRNRVCQLRKTSRLRYLSFSTVWRPPRTTTLLLRRNSNLALTLHLFLLAVMVGSILGLYHGSFFLFIVIWHFDLFFFFFSLIFVTKEEESGGVDWSLELGGRMGCQSCF